MERAVLANNYTFTIRRVFIVRVSRAHHWLILVTLLIAAFPYLFAQPEIVKWKLYTYSDDGFSVMFPDSPRIHPDRSLPNTTTYSANINPDYAVTLRVKHAVQDCNAVIQHLRANVQAGKDAIPSSLKKLPSGLEYDFPVGETRVNHLRYQCGDGRMYILAVGGERGQPLSADAAKFLDSFRILAPTTKD